MKIGVFGDSYAIGHRQSVDFHWYNLLSKKLGVSVETHGMGATSTFYSYKKFLTHHSEYDLNIFLVTHFARYTKPIHFKSTEPSPHYFSAINSVEHTLFHYDLTTEEKHSLEMLKGWFIMSDDEFLKFCQDLIVGKILEIRPNTLIIPCWQEDFSLLPARMKQLNISPKGNCFTFNQASASALGISDYITLEEKMSMIACHFTPEVSEIFAEAVFNKIKYDIPIVCPDHIEHKHPITHYYNIKS